MQATVQDLRVAFDIGGTTGKGGLFETLDPESKIAEVEFAMTKTTNEGRGNFDEDLGNLYDAIDRLMSGRKRFGHLSIAVAGNLDKTRQTLIGAGNLLHWVNKPFAHLLEHAWGVRPFIGNDAEAAGLAEGLFGHGRGKLFWLDIHGTGFGSCLVDARGEVISVFKGEGGHHDVNPSGERKCKCGQWNCLEAYVGGDALDALFGKPAWQHMSDAQWEEVADWMSIGVRNQLSFVPTDEVFFSGGLICSQPRFLGMIETNLRQELKVIKPAVCQISAFGEGAGVTGALALQSGRALLV